ncbi:J domain-containing protein [uncultured Ruegeria sp.]|uniref:J domain-containing protein n=1 Tax=uncultured Ruegeria sp. TaxID=259304 RepID=UPI00261B4C43|nr:J domain-containing protein [uncultured Ruegeria sp.]
MDALFIIFVLWVLFMLFFESIVLPLSELLVMLLWFIGIVLVTAITYVGYHSGTALLVVLSWTGKTLWRLITAPFRSRAMGRWQEPEPEPEPEQLWRGLTRYEVSCKILQLEPGNFDRAALKAAYRATMRRVHPDQGGDAEDAKVVNRAHEIICNAHGWR